MTVTTAEPGVYGDMPEDVYHADPALSSSGARKLLPPSCPARYRYERDHPPETTQALNLGTAAHALVLGKGKPLARVDAKDWRTNAAKEQRDAAIAQGCTPLLNAEYEQVQAMAAAIWAHPLASALLCRDDVATEQSLFWTDQGYGIRRRARLDAVRHGDGRLIIPDYKTTACADPAAFAKSVANYSYHQQAAWYLDAAAACLWEDAAFLFVAQEKTPPYLVTVAQLDDDAIAAGDQLNRRAIEIFRDCTESGHWPGHQPDNDIALISLPAWARPREEHL